MAKTQCELMIVYISRVLHALRGSNILNETEVRDRGITVPDQSFARTHAQGIWQSVRDYRVMMRALIPLEPDARDLLADRIIDLAKYEVDEGNIRHLQHLFVGCFPDDKCLPNKRYIATLFRRVASLLGETEAKLSARERWKYVDRLHRIEYEEKPGPRPAWRPTWQPAMILADHYFGQAGVIAICDLPEPHPDGDRQLSIKPGKSRWNPRHRGLKFPYVLAGLPRGKKLPA